MSKGGARRGKSYIPLFWLYLIGEKSRSGKRGARQPRLRVNGRDGGQMPVRRGSVARAKGVHKAIQVAGVSGKRRSRERVLPQLKYNGHIYPHFHRTTIPRSGSKCPIPYRRQRRLIQERISAGLKQTCFRDSTGSIHHDFQYHRALISSPKSQGRVGRRRVDIVKRYCLLHPGFLRLYFRRRFRHDHRFGTLCYRWRRLDFFIDATEGRVLRQ